MSGYASDEKPNTFTKKMFRHHRRAESIFEVIIAITVISIGITAITLLVTSVMRANSISKEFIIANNLATEGLEVISNLRESNWIEFPGYEEDCWNAIGDLNDDLATDVATDCTTSGNKIGEKYSSTTKTTRYFFATFDTTENAWALTERKSANKLSDQLSNTSNDKYYRLQVDSNGLYVQNDTEGTFYRMITIQYYDDTGAAVAPTSGVYMDVVSIVRWEDRFGVVHNLRKTMRLFNHLAS